MIRLINDDVLQADFAGLPPINLVVTSPPYNVGICHSIDTELLTKDGWKFYTDIQVGELAASVNPTTFEIEYHPIEKIILMDYQGDMVSITKPRSAIDIMVTPNHRCFVKKRTRWKDDRHKWEFVAAADLDKNYSHKVLCGNLKWRGDKTSTFNIDNHIIDMHLWAEFMGYYISEGCICNSQPGQYVTAITQKLGVKCETIEKCLRRLPWNVYIRNDGKYKQFVITNKSLYLWILHNVKKYAHLKIIPTLIKDLDVRCIRIFLSAYLIGDGSKSLPNSHSYYTSSKQIADSIQELELKCGNSVKINKDIRNSKLLGYYIYCKVSNDTKNYLEPIISKSDIRRVEYKGKVWCIQIKNHLFISRRNGRVGIHGNCYDKHVDTMTYDQYLAWCKQWLAKMHSVMAEDGRLCVNIPLSVTPVHLNKKKGAEDINYPIAADYVRVAQEVGFKYYRTIIWQKLGSNKTCWGSWRSARAPFVIDPNECILVCYKGTWKRKEKGESTIGGRDFMLYIKNLWTMQPETKSEHPAAFPPELPKRCIQLFSYKNDVVCDPFMGSGTTGDAAVRLERNFIGVEMSGDYFNKAKERVEGAETQTAISKTLMPNIPLDMRDNSAETW